MLLKNKREDFFPKLRYASQGLNELKLASANTEHMKFVTDTNRLSKQSTDLHVAR